MLRRSYNGTLQGHAGAPANWTLNVTVAPGTHQVDVTASWHRLGPAIQLEVVLANGTTVAGSVPGNYPFSGASVHPGGAWLQVVLTSEVTEAFEVKVEQRTLSQTVIRPNLLD
ncbi:MAG TPA: hypothetical protein VM327_08285 [Candidatus Thermoplasmatota archaeon]|nr:hypothetical protein [Candidatus Thermoplasmatota archaeon]